MDADDESGTVMGMDAASGEPVDDGSEGGGRTANRGIWIRAGIYVIGFHVFAGFIMLLFYFGTHQHH